MKYKSGFSKMSEEEIKANKKYLKIREIINAEELASLFKNETEIRLQKHNDVFEKIGKIEGEGLFSMLKTPVDIETLKELTKKFWGHINPEWQKEVESIFNETNPNVQLVIAEDNKKLIANHSILKIKGGGLQMPEDMMESLKNENIDLYNQIIEMNKDKTITHINLSLTGSLDDLYNLVHETTHYFTVRDTATEQIYSEVAPQCMERILDEFLLQLSDEELNKYKFKKEELRNDIRKRRIISFASRYKATKGFIESNDKLKNQEELLKYFLAQLFQAQFRKYDEKYKKKKIVDFIKNVRNDDFEMATKTFGIDWSNKLKRTFYIDSMIEDVRKDLEEKPNDKVIHKKRQKREKNQSKII